MPETRGFQSVSSSRKGVMVMVSQAVNKTALKRYERFVSALDAVRSAVADADPLIKQMVESRGRFAGWQVPDKKEVQAAREKVSKSLDVLRTASKTYEKELVSRQWMV